MTQYIVRRLLVSIPILLAVIFVVFMLARVIPGNPCLATLGERATPQQCAEFAARYGLDQPLPIQFIQYVEGILTGDLGTSIQYRLPVIELIMPAPADDHRAEHPGAHLRDRGRGAPGHRLGVPP